MVDLGRVSWLSLLKKECKRNLIVWWETKNTNSHCLQLSFSPKIDVDCYIPAYTKLIKYYTGNASLIRITHTQSILSRNEPLEFADFILLISAPASHVHYIEFVLEWPDVYCCKIFVVLFLSGAVLIKNLHDALPPNSKIISEIPYAILTTAIETSPQSYISENWSP